MSKIRILPQKIANKIAAGEVVERPASVVKELLENAIDAGATRITINIENGGAKKIRVVDNGEGMGEEDLKKCVLRHGTSKIKTEEDLLKINSLGFRGEALSSIAAVSRVLIKSKTENETAGTAIEVEEGTIKAVQSVGMPTGTVVAVEDIFYNTPARKKFLKSAPTEFRHSSEIVVDNALSFSNIGFTLTHNDRTVYDLPGSQGLRERIKNLLGSDINDNLVEIFFDHPHLKISGFVARPQVSGGRPYKQYTFVNHRRVRDRTVAAAARDAYGTLLPSKTYPIFIVFLELPYEMVDVNVHPRKEEVKFVQQNFIYNSVKNAVAAALRKGDLTFRNESIDRFKRKSSIGPKPTVTELNSVRDYELKPEEFLKQVLPWETKETRSFEEPIADRREILQVHNLYLITESADGFAIFDQHAAHERILYEKLLEEFKKEKKQRNVQPLLVAQQVNLSPPDAEVLKENAKTLEKLGFEIAPFGKNSFKISCVPTVLKNRNSAALIGEIVDDLREDAAPKDIDQKSLRAISFLACRGAVKAGDPLSKEERRSIVAQLDKTKTKYTCPHGRPVKIEVSLKELAKMFKRR